MKGLPGDTLTKDELASARQANLVVGRNYNAKAAHIFELGRSLCGKRSIAPRERLYYVAGDWTCRECLRRYRARATTA